MLTSHEALEVFNSFNYENSLSNESKQVLNFCRNTWLAGSTDNLNLVDIRMALHKDFIGYPQEQIELNDNNYSAHYQWYPSDNLPTFQDNYKDPVKFSLLQKLGYSSKTFQPLQVTYKLNKFGFRCKEFNDNPGIVFLGCSFTSGIGVEQELVFPQLVANHFDLECWNLGMPGKGPDIPALYASLFMRQEIKNIKALVVFWPPTARNSIFVKNHQGLRIENLHEKNNFYKHLKPDYLPPLHKELNTSLTASNLGDIVDYFNLFKVNNFMRYLTYFQTFKNIANELGVPFVHLSTDDVYDQQGLLDLGRDLSHFGRITHRKIADLIIKELDK